LTGIGASSAAARPWLFGIAMAIVDRREIAP
jgi:hypothetical protein